MPARPNTRFHEATRRRGIQGEWRVDTGDIIGITKLHARYADLTIVGQGIDLKDAPYDLRFLPQELALGVGRPVLVVPRYGTFDTVGERVLVAWNGSREATRAVHDALPILKLATTVTVLSIDPERDTGERMPSADIALHLARHGVAAEGMSTLGLDISVGDLLLSRAADLGADLIVMGAYGHSRVREMVLGGATRTHPPAHDRAGADVPLIRRRRQGSAQEPRRWMTAARCLSRMTTFRGSLARRGTTFRLAPRAGGAHASRAFPASLDPNDRCRPDAMSPRSSGPARQHASVETLTPISDARYPVTREWHALSPAEVAKLLSVNPDGGLSDTEARGRLARVGANVVGEHPETPLWRLALAQFRSLVVLLLLAASVIAAALGERVESVAILAALLLNAGIGFFTEWRARISLAKLRALTVPEALVRREGAIVKIRAAEVVPGDLLVLEAGAHVPADARLIRSSQLRTAEAALTGESVPVDKDVDARLAPETALADRRTMVYLGTTVVAGTGLAVVTATGFATELGRIGQLVALAGERATPLERQVEELGRRLMGFALATCGLVGLAGLLHGQPLGLMLETAITLAIAAVPEGLPAVTTVALAAGLWRLARAGALVRRLPAVETLGSTTVICSDKTGTMTENRMAVSRILVDPETIAIAPRPSGTSRAFIRGGAVVDPLAHPRLARLLTVGALVNDASVTDGPDGLVFQGDPTEIALLAAALDAGLDPMALARRCPRRARGALRSRRSTDGHVPRGRRRPDALCEGRPCRGARGVGPIRHPGGRRYFDPGDSSPTPGDEPSPGAGWAAGTRDRLAPR